MKYGVQQVCMSTIKGFDTIQLSTQYALDENSVDSLNKRTNSQYSLHPRFLFLLFLFLFVPLPFIAQMPICESETH